MTDDLQQTALRARVTAPGPKKMLTIDGGGIRGVLALGVLERMEAILREESGRPDLVLADYFDAIAGTSTGAIVAAGLARGMTVQSLIAFYVDSGKEMFRKSSLVRRVWYKYEKKALAQKLRQADAFGDLRLGSQELRTVLMMLMRNATTDSPWQITNNPFEHYNQPGHPDCNLRLPLWRLIRASTAAPVYFPPEEIPLGARKFLFVDGGVTMYNNPAFQLFLMMTLDRYWRAADPAQVRPWAVGTDKLLLMSVGTGTVSGENQGLSARDMHLLFNAKGIASVLMLGALNEQDTLCRVFGECVAGDRIDRTLDTMIGAKGPMADKLFRYARYNADLTAGGLLSLGFVEIDPPRVQQLDSVKAIDDLLRIGRAVGETKLRKEHFDFATFAP
jgi:hypothetical protein